MCDTIVKSHDRIHAFTLQLAFIWALWEGERKEGGVLQMRMRCNFKRLDYISLANYIEASI